MRVALVVLLVLLVSCGPATPPTPLPTPTLTPTPVPKIPTYQVNPDKSIINYLATGPLNIQFPGTFSIQSGVIQLPADSNGVRVKFDAVINGNSVTAVNGLVRDALRNNLEVNKYPTGHFTAESKEIINIGTEPVQFTAVGTLTLHGRTRNVTMPLAISLRNGVVRADGEMGLDLLDYEVNVPTAVMSSKVTFKAEVTAEESVIAAATSER